MSEKAKLVLDGVEYPLVIPDDMTMGEHRAYEQIVGEGVIALAQMEKRGFRYGPVIGWMAICVKREKPNLSMDEIMERLDALKPDEVEQVWRNSGGQNPPESEAPPNFDAKSESDEIGNDASEPVSELYPVKSNPPAFGPPQSGLADFDHATSEG